MRYKEKLKMIAEYYGEYSQTRQLIEEIAELMIAINKLWRIDQNPKNLDSVKIDKAINNFIEEIADEKLCLIK